MCEVEPPSKTSKAWSVVLSFGQNLLGQKSYALAAVMNGWSLNSLQSEFFLVLRNVASLVSRPSAYKLRQAMQEFHQSLRLEVNKELQKNGMMYLTCDGWENPQKLPTLCFATVLPEASCTPSGWRRKGRHP